jgi:hypothetical protein
MPLPSDVLVTSAAKSLSSSVMSPVRAAATNGGPDLEFYVAAGARFELAVSYLPHIDDRHSTTLQPRIAATGRSGPDLTGPAGDGQPRLL